MSSQVVQLAAFCQNCGTRSFCLTGTASSSQITAMLNCLGCLSQCMLTFARILFSSYFQLSFDDKNTIVPKELLTLFVAGYSELWKCPSSQSIIDEYSAIPLFLRYPKMCLQHRKYAYITAHQDMYSMIKSEPCGCMISKQKRKKRKGKQNRDYLLFNDVKQAKLGLIVLH